MIFERIEDTGLSQYSYVLGCEAAGSIAVVDPRRDVDVYLDFAGRKGLRIGWVLDTHIHADCASGARELAERSGAQLCLSAYDEGEDFEVAYPHRALRDGEAIEIGAVRLTALHTPGHTPEHLSFLVHDLKRSAESPMLLLSGDFLFVGSLGRPDLLGEAAKRRLAGQLFESVRGVLAGLPDGLEVHPGHGAGSMCGAGMSGRPCSTLGFERIANPYLDPGLDREGFIETMLAGVPPFPPYYRRMKALNSAGPPLLRGLPGNQPLEAERFAALLDEGAVALDLSSPRDFGAGHVPGAFGIGAGDSLSTWASWLLPHDRPILLVPRSPAQVEPALRALVRVGLDDVRGYLEGGTRAWAASGRPLATLEQIEPRALEALRAEGEAVFVLDVRARDEWAGGHIEGAGRVLCGEIAEKLDAIPRDAERIAVVCAGGYRSTAAASVLAREGYAGLMNVTGGMDAWRAAGLPTTR